MKKNCIEKAIILQKELYYRRWKIKNWIADSKFKVFQVMIKKKIIPQGVKNEKPDCSSKLQAKKTHCRSYPKLYYKAKNNQLDYKWEMKK